MLTFLLFCNLALQWGEIESGHRTDKARLAKLANEETYRTIDRRIPPGTSVILNLPATDEVRVMFYHKNLIAHSWCLDSGSFSVYIRRGLRVAYFPARPGYEVPAYVSRYWNAYRIPVGPE